MTIEEHILANDVLREVNEILPTPFLKGVLETQTIKGMAKYPNLVNVDDYDVVGWIDHNIQELIDSTVYYKLAIKRIEKDYDYYGEHARIVNLLNDEIRTNIGKLNRLELIRTHYTEEPKNELR